MYGHSLVLGRNILRVKLSNDEGLTVQEKRVSEETAQGGAWAIAQDNGVRWSNELRWVPGLRKAPRGRETEAGPGERHVGREPGRRAVMARAVWKGTSRAPVLLKRECPRLAQAAGLWAGTRVDRRAGNWVLRGYVFLPPLSSLKVRIQMIF